MVWLTELTVSVLVALVVAGCKEATPPPANVSKQLVAADRIEATNTYFHCGTTVSNNDVSVIAKGISTAGKNVARARMDWTSPNVWQLQFVAGNNIVATIPIVHDSAQIQNIDYIDNSEAIEALWKKLENYRVQVH